MNFDQNIISTMEELETFISAAENGSLGIDQVAGIALATSNADGRRFIALLDDNQQLLLGRWVTEEIFHQGQDLVRYGKTRKH